MVFHDDALILDHSRFRDRHVILSVLSAEHGVVRGVLHNARGGKNNAGATLQVLSLVRVTVHQAPAADMATFRQIDLLRSSFPLSADFQAAAAAAVVAELLISFCPIAESAPRRYRLGLAALDALLQGRENSAVVAYAQMWILQLSGLLPEMHICSQCATVIESRFRFSKHEGLPLCDQCSQPGLRSLSTKDLETLSRFASSPPSQLDCKPSSDLASWLDLLVRSTSEKSMRALDFFRRYTTS